ncbi:MAG: molecular chaperone TorD family protein [Actinomycetes bacterium]
MTTWPLTQPPAPARARDRAELFRAIGVLAESPGTMHPRLADLLDLPRPAGVDWTEAFVVQLVPHGSIYVGAEGMLGGAAADRVAGFWRALHLPVPAEPDHVSTLLGLYASLVDAEQDEPPGPRRTLYGQARAALLHEHLLSWLPPYANAMIDSGPWAYREWARLLREALLAEADDVGVPERLPMHLRAVAPLLADGSLDELLAGLLTPARSGVVLTRAHLARIARLSGLGLRLGNRRAVLRALIEQNPAATLTALAAQARTWLARHQADRPTIGLAAGHWADRAAVTADLLTAAAGQARLAESASGQSKEEHR